jgi:guanylate kinase
MLKVFIMITGPSGVGKSTMCKLLRERFRSWAAAPSVSSTTRTPREGEVNGVNYFYLSPGRFLHMVAEREFLECALYNGNLYGTSRKMLDIQFDRTFIVIGDLNVDGCQQILAHRYHDFEPIVFALLPDDMSVLEKRIRARPGATDGEVAGRMGEMTRELEIIQGGEFGAAVISREGAIEEAADLIERKIRERFNL